MLDGIRGGGEGLGMGWREGMGEGWMGIFSDIFSPINWDVRYNSASAESILPHQTT